MAAASVTVPNVIRRDLTLSGLQEENTAHRVAIGPHSSTQSSGGRPPPGNLPRQATLSAGSAIEAVTDADVTLLLTEWREFLEADPEELGKAVSCRNIVDGRNALDAARWRAASWHYRALGAGARGSTPA